jgi:alkylhydroperoxidase family enzyme
MRPEQLILNDAEADEAAHCGKVPEFFTNMNLFKGLLTNPKMAYCESELLGCLYYHSSVEDRLRELIVMRIAWKLRCKYVWTQHLFLCEHIFLVDQEVILETRNPYLSKLLTNEEMAVLLCVDSLIEKNNFDAFASAKLFSILKNNRKKYNEIMYMIGHWVGLSLYCIAAQLQCEDKQERWPPDGLSPADYISEAGENILRFSDAIEKY